MKTIDLLVQELPALGGFPDGAVGAGFLCSNDTLYFVNKDGDCPSEWRISMNYEVEDRWVEVTREQYEAALSAKNDGWIEWGGGECPVADFLKVEYQLRGGAKGSDPAKILEWQHEGGRHDIIAYRLHQPQEVAQTESEQEADLNDCIGQTPATVWNGEGLPPVGCECEAKFRHRNSAEWMHFRCVAVDCDVAFGWAGKDAVALEWGSYQFRHIRSEAERKRERAAQALCNAGGGNGKVDEKAGYGSCWFDVYDAIVAGKIPGVKLED